DLNYVRVMLGKGDGSFQAPIQYTVQKSPFDVAAGDFNGDGKPDLATANADSGDVGVLLGNGDGTFGQPVYYPTGANSGSQDLDLGDFNGDGKLDLAVANGKLAIV